MRTELGSEVELLVITVLTVRISGPSFLTETVVMVLTSVTLMHILCIMSACGPLDLNPHKQSLFLIFLFLNRITKDTGTSQLIKFLRN